MNKNAYEIRLELLQLAHGDIMTQYHETLNAQRESIPYDENGNRNTTTVDCTLPDTAQVIQRATELYTFIEGK